MPAGHAHARRQPEGRQGRPIHGAGGLQCVSAQAGFQALLAVFPHVQRPGANRPHYPFLPREGVVVDAELAHVQGDVARALRSIDHQRDSSRMCQHGNFLNGHAQAARELDVAQGHKHGALGEGALDGCQNLGH